MALLADIYAPSDARSVVDTASESIAGVRAAAAALPTSVTVIQALTDTDLLDVQRGLADARRAIDACASLIAGEVSYRSRRELGYSGLAQRAGFPSAVKLVQHTTGSTARDAGTLVQVGEIVHSSAAGPAAVDGSEQVSPENAIPWLAGIGAAVTAGLLSVDQAKSISNGLGAPTTEITAEQLELLAEVLLAEVVLAEDTQPEAGRLNPDQLLARARELRDSVDDAGIAERERVIHEQRSLRRYRQGNGLHKYVLVPDIETAAFLDDLYDRVTSPRRGGPRFVDPADASWAASVSVDPRTTDQYAHDQFTGLLQIATTRPTAEVKQIVGSRMPAVRVLATRNALTKRAGHGRIEGQPLPVSIQTVERIACETGTVPLVFDDNGQALNLGRQHRTFSQKQKIMLAARDGGCMDPDCTAPPSWCEGHHTEHWDRDTGHTNIDLGILLCRFHHLMVHNNGWEIERRIQRSNDGRELSVQFWLIPPPGISPAQQPRPLRSKSTALADFIREAGARQSEVTR